MYSQYMQWLVESSQFIHSALHRQDKAECKFNEAGLTMLGQQSNKFPPDDNQHYTRTAKEFQDSEASHNILSKVTKSKYSCISQILMSRTFVARDI